MTTLSNLQQRWTDFRPTKTQAFWACAACVVATLIAGFGGAGWVTAATASKAVDEAAERARTQLAVSVCVDEFMHERDAAARLAKLKATEFFQRSDLIATGGYATMPGEKEADGAVAAQCAAALDEASLKK